jgi:hypothetical protein
METPLPDTAAPLPSPRWSLEKPKLLIVEGKDEKRLLPLLMEHHSIDGIQVEDIGGKTLLQRNLRQVRLQMGQAMLSSIGILRDADDDPARAFQSVCSALSANGFTPPLAPGVFTDNAPRIGVFILPDARTEGALETLCLGSVGDDPALACMSGFFECIGGVPDNTTAGQVAHAQAQVYLASKFCGISQAGIAAEAQCWDFASPVWNPLKLFLFQL